MKFKILAATSIIVSLLGGFVVWNYFSEPSIDYFKDEAESLFLGSFNDLGDYRDVQSYYDSNPTYQLQKVANNREYIFTIIKPYDLNNLNYAQDLITFKFTKNSFFDDYEISDYNNFTLYQADLETASKIALEYDLLSSIPEEYNIFKSRKITKADIQQVLKSEELEQEEKQIIQEFEQANNIEKLQMLSDRYSFEIQRVSDIINHDTGSDFDFNSNYYVMLFISLSHCSNIIDVMSDTEKSWSEFGTLDCVKDQSIYQFYFPERPEVANLNGDIIKERVSQNPQPFINFINAK
jgi:hypothetical protein